MIGSGGNGKLIRPSEFGGFLLDHKTAEPSHSVDLIEAPDFELAAPVSERVGDILENVGVDLEGF